MSKLEYFKFEVKPFVYGGLNGGSERLYEITIQANGERFIQTSSGIPPTHMSEIEFLTRMSWKAMRACKEKFGDDDSE